MRRTMNPCRAWLLSTLVGLWPALAVSADIYRWTDDQGRVHYSERPPPEGADRVELPAGAQRGAQSVAIDPQRRARQQRLLQTYEYERQRKREQAAKAESGRQQLARRCGELKRQWRTLSHAGPIFTTTADGRREYYSDAQRTAAKSRLRPAYREACGEDPR